MVIYKVRQVCALFRLNLDSIWVELDDINLDPIDALLFSPSKVKSVNIKLNLK